METQKTFIPAAGSDWLLPLYDPITRLIGLDTARQVLLEEAAVRPHSRVLEIGCGTGSFSILIKQLNPDVEVVGLDPDPNALARAKRKSERAKVSIQLDRGFSDSLPYDDATFDYVFSSMMFHHLNFNQKQNTLREVRRILKPGALLAMLDFKKPESTIGRLVGGLLHSDVLQDNSENQILAFMSEAGFSGARSLGQRRLLLGHVVYYQARN